MFEFCYDFPGWPLTVRGRAKLIALYSGYGNSIRLHSSDALVVHPSRDGRVVVLEYEVHGQILTNGKPYDNRFVPHLALRAQIWGTFFGGDEGREIRCGPASPRSRTTAHPGPRL